MWTRVCRIFICLLFGFAFTVTDVITWEKECVSMEYAPMYYGFPFIHRSGNFACTECFQLYLIPFIANILCWAALLFGIIYLLSKIKEQAYRTVLKYVGSIFIGLWFLLSLLMIWVSDWTIYNFHDHHRDHGKNVECEYSLKYPKLFSED